MTDQLINKIRSKSARICVVGLGYVGLPTAVSFAEKGFTVIGADINKDKVNSINKAKTPLPDIDIQERLALVVKAKKLSATTDIPKAVSQSDIITITVPTPVTEAKIPDLGCVESASDAIAKGLRKGQLVILESTTFPGTTDDVVKPRLEKTGLVAGKDFGLAFCPERYNPGDREHPLDNIERIVGGIDARWGEAARELYQNITKRKVTRVRDMKTAEAAKVIENIQRDLNIALINELSLIFDKMGIDAVEVIEAASTKWNFVKLYPGPGVGGHCLPVDPYYLTHKAQELGYHPKVILAGREINDSMPRHVVDKLTEGLNSVGKAVKGSKIAVLGLSYKGNLGDMRESPATTIVKLLKKSGANVFTHDPLVSQGECMRLLGLKNTTVIDSLNGADCVVIATDHPQFKAISIQKLKSLVKKKAVIVDTRQVFSPAEVTSAGMVFKAIGRREDSPNKR